MLCDFINQSKKISNINLKFIFDTQNDGFTVKAFHDKCDLKTNILVFI